MRTSSQLKRTMNPDKKQAVTIILNPQQIEIVNRLFKTGLYGHSAKKTVEQIFCEGLKPHAL